MSDDTGNDAFDWVPGELAELDRRALRRSRPIRRSSQGARIELDGRRLVNFGSNDYLGLAAELDPQRSPESGWGSGASPMICGRGASHAELERRLATFEHTESALWFSSGFAANTGVLGALASKEDAIFSDAGNHASIIDGCRMSGARVIVYPHADAKALRERLGGEPRARRTLIVSDSLFSMDGDIAPLGALTELAAEFNAMLVVDEAHATGVFGARGRGIVEHLGLEASVRVRVGTLSKALGSVGGFVVGPTDVIEWIAHRARSYFFSTAPPDACARAALDALDRVEREPWRRERVRALSDRARAAFIERGWDTGTSASPIVPVIVGTAERAMRLHERLRDRGLFVPGIRPPSVPQGASRLRVSFSARHSDEDVERLIAELDACAAPDR
ncbi:MAG: 8-amino-7-oxononanoate synthase [Planctomycetes bacterium]|nr:8-amino-7-oxononanoate synthase [Planctomycetota bacterium]